MRAYSDSEFVSFSTLKSMQGTGEPVEVYANNIWKLARGAGLKGEGYEQVVKLTFITGFPDSISVELQQIQNIEKMTVSDVLGRARILAASSGRAKSSNVSAAVVNKGAPQAVSDHQEEKYERREIKCYRCGGNHVVKNCPYDVYGNKQKTGDEKEVCGLAL